MAADTTWPVSDNRLEARFSDAKPLFSTWEAATEAARCLYCHDAPCITACPTAVDVPGFIRKITTGNLSGAARTVLRANLLGLSCARVCPVEVLCEGACVYVGWGRPPVRIGRLQRYAVETGGAAERLTNLPLGKGSVGLVGAGPASLACAGRLALLGHAAIIYEKSAIPGGLNSTGIAPYKLRMEDALAEIEFVQSLGVEIRTGIDVGRDLSAEELLSRHDTVFLGPGLGRDTFLGVAGENGPGVVGAIDWIRKLKTDPAFSVAGVRSAIVVGGGNTAVDAARELAGLGVESVTLVYRRTEPVMKAYTHELAAARQAGVVLIPRAAVVEVLRGGGDRGGAVTAVRLVETEDGRPTERGRGIIETDLVVMAIGQAKLRDLAALFSGVACDERGCILVDPQSCATGNARVFAGGDAVNGGREVVNAVHDGQVAAQAMHALLARGGEDA